MEPPIYFRSVDASAYPKFSVESDPLSKNKRFMSVLADEATVTLAKN